MFASPAAWAEEADLGHAHTTDKPHWAFIQPERPPLPPVRASESTICNPIDRFVVSRLERAGLSPAPRADRRTLIRRATFDLHGLPPTPEEVAAFQRDDSPDAWTRLIDRLLGSPRYGQRWGRYWLDVARYADTKGYVYDDREDKRYVHSYPYRDWVIRALNEDMPYDRFLRLQIAADRMDCQPGDLAAMGFLTLGRRFLGVKHDIIDDRIDVLTRGLQGLSVSCARCHDHKFDPIPTQDYYSLYGVFDSTTERLVPIDTSTHRTQLQLDFERGLAERTEKFDAAYQEAREEVAQQVRKRTADYLAAQATADKLPSEEFYEILDVNDVNPVFVRRWQAYLRETSKSFHPVFAPWHAFAALPEKEFAATAPAAWRELKAKYADAMNPRVVAAFDGQPPRSMKDVAQRYGALFTAVLENGKQKNDAGATEAIRQVLYAPDAPVYPPMGSLADTHFYFEEATRVKLGKLYKDIEVWHLTAEGAMPYAGILQDLAEPHTPHVFQRGNPGNRGEEVPRQFLQVVAGPQRKPFTQGSGRLEMADLIASRDNPLTSRVMVNRVWLHHFGAGIVSTPSDFGTRGEPPSHPQLLDWLAVEFMEQGWSLKKLHRLIMSSSVYQQSSTTGLASATRDPEAASEPSGSGTPGLIDPENRLLWRMNRRRLDFEALRDSLLAVSGDLDFAVDGKSVDLFEAPFPRRRSVYGHIDRVVVPGALRAFDVANPDLHSPRRHETTVPQQALYLMNSPFVIERAQSWVAKLPSANDDVRVRQLYNEAYQRQPAESELARSLKFVREARQDPTPDPSDDSTRPLDAWSALGQVLLLSNEFSCVD